MFRGKMYTTWGFVCTIPQVVYTIPQVEDNIPQVEDTIPQMEYINGVIWLWIEFFNGYQMLILCILEWIWMALMENKMPATNEMMAPRYKPGMIWSNKKKS